MSRTIASASASSPTSSARAGSTAEALDAHCLASPTLARFKRPRDYRFVDELPKSASGKLLRRMLRTTEETT